MRKKKEKSPYSFSKKQSLDYLTNLSWKEISWFGLRALVRVLITQEIMGSSDAQYSAKESPLWFHQILWIITIHGKSRDQNIRTLKTQTSYISSQ